MNSTMKYIVNNNIQGHRKFKSRTIFPNVLDTKMIVHSFKMFYSRECDIFQLT